MPTYATGTGTGTHTPQAQAHIHHRHRHAYTTGTGTHKPQAYTHTHTHTHHRHKHRRAPMQVRKAEMCWLWAVSGGRCDMYVLTMMKGSSLQALTLGPRNTGAQTPGNVARSRSMPYPHQVHVRFAPDPCQIHARFAPDPGQIHWDRHLETRPDPQQIQAMQVAPYTLLIYCIAMNYGGALVAVTWGLPPPLLLGEYSVRLLTRTIRLQWGPLEAAIAPVAYC